MRFKLWLEENNINWPLENPSRWEGSFKVGDSQFLVSVEFSPVLSDPYEKLLGKFTNPYFASQTHLKPKHIQKTSLLATVDFEDESGSHIITGKIQNKTTIVQHAMAETFEKLWREREPDFITFQTKEATKIMAWDQFIWRSNPILKHYIVLKMPKAFRNVTSLNPTKHFSTWLLQKKKATQGQESWFNQHRDEGTHGYEGQYQPYLPGPDETETNPELRRHSFRYQIIRMKLRQQRGITFPDDDKLKILLGKVLAAKRRRKDGHSRFGDEKLLPLLDDNNTFDINKIGNYLSI